MAVLFKLKEWKQTSHRFQVTLLHFKHFLVTLLHCHHRTKASWAWKQSLCQSCHVSQNRQVAAFWEQILGGWLSKPSSRLLVDGQLSCLTSTKDASHSVEEDCGSFAQDWQIISGKQFTNNEYWACPLIVFGSITLGIRWLTCFTSFSTMSMSGESEDLGYK